MRIGPADGWHNRWYPDVVPAASIEPGELMTFETRDGLDGQLTRESTHADCATPDLGLAHPLTGPVHVAGAEPGDVLEVQFVAYETPDFGVNCVIPGFGFLADLFDEPFLVAWELDGAVARSAELPGIAVPAVVHAGVAGVAPSHALMERQREREEAIRAAGGPVAEPMPESAHPPIAADGLRTIPPRETGGNLDIRRLTVGSTLLLPVHVPGALFSLGDVHFAQGDGEVCGTGIEIAAAVTVRFGLRKAPRFAQGVSRVPGPRAPRPCGLCDHRHPRARSDGPDAGRARGAARHDRLAGGRARPVTARRVLPLLGVRRPPPLPGRRRAVPARLGTLSARHLRIGSGSGQGHGRTSVPRADSGYQPSSRTSTTRTPGSTPTFRMSSWPRGTGVTAR